MSGSISSPAGFFFNDPSTPTSAADLQSALVDAEANLAAAGTSAAAAAASATAAASSASAAASSATTASAATSSATAAASSATNAASSATAASGSATTASTAATTATTQAGNASTSATAAATSVTSATTQATNAATSATNAGNSATAASGSASAAATSATNAASSAASAASVAGAASAANTGRNKLHNAQLNVAQRGAGPWTTAGYTADRWALGTAHSNGTVSVTLAALSDANRTTIGDEEATVALQAVVVGGTGAGDYDQFFQRIENVRRLSGKTVMVSFWAAASSGTPKVGVSLDQNFGTGGSPSTAIQNTGTTVTISTTLTRYSIPFALGSTSGKTLGTNGDSNTQLNLWLSSGSTNNTRAGSIGVQSNTVSLWGVQLEVASTATPLEKVDPRVDLSNCQRFYQIGAFSFIAYNTSAAAVGQSLSLPVTMRTTPTVTSNYTTQTNATAGSIQAVGNACVEPFATTTATGAVGLAGTFTASADL